MEGKKILIVSRSFFPENTPRGFRTTELAKQFARTGHEVTVITPRNAQFHNAFEQEHGIRIKDLGQQKWKPIAVHGKGIFRVFRRIWVRLASLLIIYPEIELMFMVKRVLRKERERHDVLISIAAPHPVHWGTAWAIRKNRVAERWIADCGDPFMGGENDTFKRLFYFKYFEKWFCRRADYITVPIEQSIPAYYPEFRQKIRVIPQGFRFEDIERVERKTQSDVPVFAYAGTLIPKIRDPYEFFEFICTSDLDYRFIIYTNNKDYLRKYQERSMGKIEIRSFIPRTELLAELQQMDFVVNFENRGPKQSPSKLIDYAIIEKPILSVKTFGFSADVLMEFMKGDYRNQLRIDDPDQYRIENVCRNFINLIN